MAMVKCSNGVRLTCDRFDPDTHSHRRLLRRYGCHAFVCAHEMRTQARMFASPTTNLTPSAPCWLHRRHAHCQPARMPKANAQNQHARAHTPRQIDVFPKAKSRSSPSPVHAYPFSPALTLRPGYSFPTPHQDELDCRYSAQACPQSHTKPRHAARRRSPAHCQACCAYTARQIRRWY